MKQTIIASIVSALVLSACSQDNPLPNTSTPLHAADVEVEFTILVENISQSTTLSSALSPLVWSLSPQAGALLKEDQTASPEFEKLAEDGAPEALADRADVDTIKGHLSGPIAPGSQMSFRFKAKPGMRLSFAGMLVETNDIFVALQSESMTLFDADNEPIAPGPLTLALWDAGTEVNQAPGQGADQAPRQALANTGSSENSVIKHLDEINDGFSYPEAGQLLRVTLQHNHEHSHAETDHQSTDSDHDHAH